MLSAIGEAPVNSIAASNVTQDAAIALNVLDEASRDIQAIGWFFNTEHNVILQRDSNDYIPVAGNIMELDADTSEHPDVNITIRGDFLYDLKKETTDRFAFDTDITADVIYLLEFTDLPQTARRLIVATSSRMLADRVVGSAELSKILRQDENFAYENLIELNTSMADANYISDSSSSNASNRYI